MDQDIKTQREFQIGVETVNTGDKGTAVTPTAIMRGVHEYADETEIVFKEENVGFLMGTNDTYLKSKLAKVTWGASPITFEQFPYVLAAGIKGQVTGVQDGAGSDYIYTYRVPQKESDVCLVGIGIAFVASGPTITDSNSGLAIFLEGDTIKVTGTTLNNDIFTVTASAAGELSITPAPTDESAGTSFTIRNITATYTMRAGSAKKVWEADYGFVPSFEISGEGGSDQDAVMLSAEWISRQWVPALYEDLALPTTATSVFSKTKFYIDAVGGTIGTTQLDNLLTSYTLSVDTGLFAMFAAHGQDYFADAFLRKPPEITLECSLNYTADAIAQQTAYLARTPKLLRIELVGPAVATGGTTYSNKLIRIDLPGSWEVMPNLEDIDGAGTIPCTFRAQYDPTAALSPSFMVVNELSALT